MIRNIVIRHIEQKAADKIGRNALKRIKYDVIRMPGDEDSGRAAIRL